LTISGFPHKRFLEKMIVRVINKPLYIYIYIILKKYRKDIVLIVGLRGGASAYLIELGQTGLVSKGS